MAIITPTSSSQGSPRHEDKNEAMALAMRNVLEAGLPQPTDTDIADWSTDGWSDEPLSPETVKQYQDIFAKNAAKLSKAKASDNKYSIFA